MLMRIRQQLVPSTVIQMIQIKTTVILISPVNIHLVASELSVCLRNIMVMMWAGHVYC